LLVVLALATVSVLATAQERWRWSAGAGASVAKFSQREFADSGSLLDREDGALPGLNLRLSSERANWILAAAATLQGANLDYRGQTQTGTPLTTHTNEALTGVSMTGGYRFNPDRNPVYCVYGGLAYLRWQRNIWSTESVRGLKELYQWRDLVLGADVLIVVDAQQTWRLDLRFNVPQQATIDVDFGDLYDRARLNLGRAIGWRLGLSGAHALDTQDALVIEPYYEQRKIGRSNDGVLTRSGVVVGTVFEPRGEARAFGVNVLWTRYF
jgi:hypothetical protein